MTTHEHPPILATWDWEQGQYVPAAGRVCMARWRISMDICGEPGIKEIGDTWLCQHHLERAEAWVWKTARQEMSAIEQGQRALDEERERWSKERDRRDREHHKRVRATRQRVREERSLVYYVRRVSDGLIKIGMTSDLRQRMAALELEHGELQLLHIEPGGRNEEEAAHDVWRRWWAGREWFYPGRDLMNWIGFERRGAHLPRASGVVPLGVLDKVSRGALGNPPARKYVPPRKRPSYVV